MQEFQPQKKKYKLTHILGIIFLILVGVALVSGSLFGDKEVKQGVLYKLNRDKITKIEIIRGGQESGEMIVLNKEIDGTWTADGAAADVIYVQAILDNLGELEVKKETVSENPGKQGIFEVDEMGVEVIAYYGNKIKADFFLGKFGPDFDSNYIRKKDSNKVYLTVERIGSNFSKANFQEMTMLQFNWEQAERLRIKYDEVVFEIWKEGEDWKALSPESTMPAGQVLNKTKVEDFLILLSNYRGQDVVSIDEGDDTGFDEPPLEIVVTLVDGVEKILTVGLGYPKVATYYAKSSDKKSIYVISQWQRDELKKTLDDFE